MPEIPDLGRKLSLLAKHGGLGGWYGLEKRFERKRKTLRYWGHGNADRVPNILPDDRIDAFRHALADALDLDVAEQRLADLLQGSADLLEFALLAKDAKTLSGLINAEAINQPFRIITPDHVEVDLVEIEKRKRAPSDVKVQLGQYFAIRFVGVRIPEHVLLLQQSPTAWGYIGIGQVGANQQLQVPSPEADDAPAFMRESSEIGQHRFVAVSMIKTPRINLERYKDEGLPLDAYALSALANHLRDIGKPNRSFLVAQIEVQKVGR